MRIVHVIVGLDVGGAERSLQNLVLSDTDAPREVLVVSLTRSGPVGNRLSGAGIRVVCLGMHGIVSGLLAFPRLVAVLWRFRADVVQSWMYHADLVGGLAARIAGVPAVVWGIRNSMVPGGSLKQRLVSRACARLSSSLPSAIVCVSEASISPYETAGYDATKMRVIRNGCPVGDFSAQRPRPRQGAAPIVIGCVGRWHADKGQDILLRAAALVRQRRSDFRVVLAGRDCNHANQALRGMIADLGLEDSIALLGERHDVSAVLSGFDIFCMPSRTEGFPNCLAEAMASGLYCIATDTGDAGYLLGGAGRLVETASPEALAEALLGGMDLSEAARCDIGEHANARVQIHFSVAAMRDAYYGLYRNLTRNSPDVRN